MRVAIYFVPAPDHPLSEAAGRWLGWDVHKGRPVDPASAGWLSAEDHLAFTQAPVHYGFHATLKPPFRVAAPFGIDEVDAALQRFVATRAPVTLGRLRIELIGAFFALVPSQPVPAIDALAADAVRFFERFRAPATEEETRKRRPETLSDRERSHLKLWGYPYVFEDFRFHMTLTGPVAEDRRGDVREAIGKHFAEVLANEIVVDAVSLLVEAAPSVPFVVNARRPLAAARDQMAIA